MDILNNILIWVHLGSLVIGMGSGMASGQVLARVGTAPGEARGTLVEVYKLLSRMGHIGLGILLVTGILVVFLKYGGPMSLGVWYWIKMGLVVLLIIILAVSGPTGRKALSGDAEAVALAPKLGAAAGITGFATIFAAVFAFN